MMTGNWDSYRDDLDTLKIELEKLFEVRNDVMSRVRIAEEEEQQMMKPTTDEVVQLWLSNVQALETEVDDLIRQISQEIEELHPGGFCSRNLLNMPSSYEFEDIVAEKLQAVMNLIKEGDSVVADDEARVVTIPKDEGVAENLPEDVLYDEGTIVGMESIFTKVWRCIEEEGGGYMGIIGLYGMGGVGKTTLLKQIYRNMLDNFGQNNFAVVIWVSVSKELRLEKIQEKIGMKIGLFDKVWKNKNFEEKASDILEILKEKKFVLLMDELWERVDLTKVGVPFPNPENSSKIVFTTRSLEICRLMEADRQFKINCLADEEAWELFKASVGDETLHSHPEQVVDIARDISKECSGLPLALASIGRALAGNKTPQEWRDVLGVLTRRSRSTSSISGSDDQLKKDIYYNLKSSYDHLQNDMFKSCLLYCCLFPRNDKISKGHLIDCWIGEGFLDDRLGAKSQGYHIIDVLLSACLLEEEEEDGNYVKMHNWIHDMTSWIATEIEEEKRNFFVCADADLTEPPEIEKWVNMTRISMTKNGFTNLENAPMCSHLQTLFLNKNKIEMICGDFFRFMPRLKVLNLSDNPLQELPSEISNLVSLQHLDLSHTAIKSLPKQLGALKKLKCLNLEYTLELCAIPPRLISTLSVLHVLRLQGCGFLDQSGEDSVVCKDAQLLIEELFCLKNLSMLSLGLRNSHALQKLLSSYRLQSCIQSLWLHSLQHPKSIVISISYMNHLKTLRISECEYLEELEVDFVGEAQAQGISNFYFLDKVFIESCPNLRDLTWLILAPNLKHLEISQCSELEEIIKVWKLSECLELMRNLTPFLKLQILKLSNLPNFRSIYWRDLPFPDLKEGTIAECPKLQISLPPHRFNKDHSKEKITANVPLGPSSFNRKQVDPTGSDDVCSSTITDLSTGSVPFLFSKETKDGEDDMETDEVHQVMEQKLSLEETAFPISSEGRRPLGRPGYGTMGKKCIVKANHFLVQVVDRDIHHYDVSITPEITSKKVNRDVVSELTRLYRESHLGKRMPAYDGRKSLYTAGPLPFESKEFVVKLDQDSGATSSTSKRKERKFNVTIKLVSKPDLYALQQFLQSRHLDAPYEVMQVLAIVLRASSSEKYVPVGRSFFSPDLGPMGQLGDGIEYWRGFYQSLRPTQMGLSFNIDVSAKGFYEPILVSEFVSKYINRNISTPLADHDRVKVRKSFKGIKVVLTHMGYAKSYKITGISSQPLKQLMFTLEDKVTKTSVVQYFRDKYQIVLKYTSLPALQAGSDANPIYLPMELSKIVEGQRYTKRLNERQVTALLRATCQRPHERESNIKRMVLSNDYNRDKLANEEFGIHVGGELASVDARVLPPPMLNYHESGRVAKVNPSLGQWNMINKKMINGGRVAFWTCVCFSTRVNRDLPFQFCGELLNMCKSKGMVFNPNPVIPIFSAGPNQIENALIDIHTRSTAEITRRGGKLLQLLIIILPDATGSYGRIKRVCETELGIVSQCCQPRQASKLSKQYLENVALKINVKVGGRNSVLNDAVMRRLPHVSDSPTIIIGANVTHPQPGEDSSPSIAAVVASMDWPEVTKYRGLVSAQGHRDEIIKDLYTSTQDAQRGVVHGGMIRDQLMAFRRSTGHKPYKIIFYRDGVSKGQFNQVLLHEVDAIRHACSSLEPNYVPPITFIVIQKRHHTRLFPSDRNMTDRSGNIQPGTVVDTKICHPTQFDFYLNSHAVIQGTSRPTHYHVLFDENRFTADELQMLTNNLCYTYAKCTRSVSVVPPAYYAHLVAFRARYYIEGDISDGGSSSGRGSGTREGHLLVQPLPGIKENVKDVMFFC